MSQQTHAANRPEIRPPGDPSVEPVEKVTGKTFLSDEEKRGIVECATIKISSLRGVR
jgi:hypothetical protein